MCKIKAYDKIAIETWEQEKIQFDAFEFHEII